jgi:signal peptidase I
MESRSSSSDLGASSAGLKSLTPSRTASLLQRLRGPWRVAVVEPSMAPAIEPGDWLFVDPTTVRWPRRGSVVVFRDPTDGELSVKRVAGRPGERVPFAGGYLDLADDEAWLLSDAAEEVVAAAGLGAPVDSRKFGPVPVYALVGRVWFRYAPLRRIGRISRPD